MAKTNVAPIQRMTIPRLELCGAVLLSRLLSHTSEILLIPENDIYAWTDSTVVLGWLSDDPTAPTNWTLARVVDVHPEKDAR